MYSVFCWSRTFVDEYFLQVERKTKANVCLCCDYSTEEEELDTLSEKDTVKIRAQAGWFGKGYRKGRRVKRRSIWTMSNTLFFYLSLFVFFVIVNIISILFIIVCIFMVIFSLSVIFYIYCFLCILKFVDRCKVNKKVCFKQCFYSTFL